MGSPIQMTAKLLSAKKGWPSPHAVDFATTYDASITAYVPPGAVVHVSAILTFLLGVGNLFVMPMFTLWASDSFDVTNYGGNPATDKGVWAPIVPVGTNNALVANGAYELVGTYYDTTQTYNPNDPLTSPTTGPTAGQITKGVYHTNTICGVVSRGVIDNGYGYNALAFWPVFLPV